MNDAPGTDLEDIERRLEELQPAVDEYRRLQAARAVLAEVTRSRPPGDAGAGEADQGPT